MDFLPYISKAAQFAPMLLDDIVAIAKPALSQVGRHLAAAQPAIKGVVAVVADDVSANSAAVTDGRIQQHRENAVCARLAAGSLINKLGLSAAFCGLAAFAPVAPAVLLIGGGLYLVLEGAHKILEAFGQAHDPESPAEATAAGPAGVLAHWLGADDVERRIVKELLIFDTVLAMEIILIARDALSDVKGWALAEALAQVSLAATAIVYGPIWAIMRSDNVAGWLEKSQSAAVRMAGRWLTKFIPPLLKALTVIGTAAMLEVGGGILLEKIAPVLAALGLVSAAAAAAQLAENVHHLFAAFTPRGVSELVAFAAVGLAAGMALAGSQKAVRWAASGFRGAAG